MNGKIVTAGDLRIGNWVCIEYIGYAQIKSISNDHFITGSIERTYDECQPIPLSGELLEKCGFEKEQYSSRRALRYYLGESTFLVSNYDKNEVYIDKPDIDDDHFPDFTFSCHCKYLHQLQNLFYCLTGEELEVKM